VDIQQTILERIPYRAVDSLSVGCGNNPQARSLGWLNLDRESLPGVDIVCDVEKSLLPFPDNTFAEIALHHIYEHFVEPLPIMEEVYRVLKPQGKVSIVCPYYRHPRAYSDPDHKAFISEMSFLYLYAYEYNMKLKTNMTPRPNMKCRFKLISSNYIPDKKYRALPDIVKYKDIIADMIESVEIVMEAIKDSTGTNRN
jgi:ubiquinone/menaquinone biosynthesis C-methylase UbiE